MNWLLVLGSVLVFAGTVLTVRYEGQVWPRVRRWNWLYEQAQLTSRGRWVGLVVVAVGLVLQGISTT